MRAGRITLAAVASIGLAVATAPPVQATTPVVEPQVISDDTLTARSLTTDGGAKVLATTRTVAHWNGRTTDPNNGVTYSYNMVGADPNTCSGSGCDVTVQVDITPVV